MWLWVKRSPLSDPGFPACSGGDTGRKHVQRLQLQEKPPELQRVASFPIAVPLSANNASYLTSRVTEGLAISAALRGPKCAILDAGGGWNDTLFPLGDGD